MLNAKAKSELKEVGFLGRLWCTSIVDTPFYKNYIKLILLQSLSYWEEQNKKKKKRERGKDLKAFAWEMAY